jgi:hypothetical protein
MIVGHVKDGLRAGAAAVGVAASLMALASTSQTPDGFIHASFGGPMDVFSPGRASDILAIGDGAADDASELAALLKGPASPTAEIPDSPIRAAFEAGTTASPAAPVLMPSISPTVTPTLKDSAILPVKPVVDAQGKVDCTGSVSCKTDPTTNITTVTYPDGIVAIVQKVNDLTVVAYKSLTDVLPDEVAAWLPPVPEPGQVFLGAPAAPTATQAVAPPPLPTAAAVPSPSPDITVPSFDPGPIAPVVGIPDADDSRRGPRVNVVRPPMDFSPDSDTGGSTSTGGRNPNFPVLGKVKDALGSAVDAVTDAVGKAISPGASDKPSGSGQSRGGGSSGP